MKGNTSNVCTYSAIVGRKNEYVPTYLFSNSPVRCLFTKVVLPTPPSPTRISLNSGTDIFSDTVIRVCE